MFYPNFFPSSQRGRVIYYCLMMVQRTSVASVAAQQGGYFENTVKYKSISIDLFTNMYYTCNV